jgi:hypothetical protein
MNWANILLGIIILIICIAIAIFTEGLALPIILPIAVWALDKMGVKA